MKRKSTWTCLGCLQEKGPEAGTLYQRDNSFICFECLDFLRAQRGPKLDCIATEGCKVTTESR